MCSLVFAAVLTCSISIFAQEVGDTVVVMTQEDAKLRVGTEVVQTVPRNSHLEVEDSNNDAYFVTWKYKSGWIMKVDALPLHTAIQRLTNELKTKPSARAYHSRGTIWGKTGQYDKAIADYNEAIRLNPMSPINYTNRGRARKDMGEYDKAIADYNEAIRLGPKCALPCNNLAWLLATCPESRYRNGKQAVENARRACEFSDWRVWFCLGTLAAAYAELGNFDEAIKWQNKTIESAPQDKQAERQSRLELYKSGKAYREGTKE